jgi:uncharacterized protein YneF (UPF0154 family)
MDIVRKLFFAPFFLFSLVLMLVLTDRLMIDPLGILFGFNAENAWALLYLVGTLLLTSFFYIIFVSLSNDWRIVLPVVIIASLVPPGLYQNITLGFYISAGILTGALIGFFVQQQKMQNYITFSATTLLQPQIKLMNLFLIITLSVGFYFSADAYIKEKGFSIPEPLIEAAISMSGQQDQINEMEVEEESSIPTLSPELITQLKQNPQLLKQYGVTAAQLDALSSAQQKNENGSSGTLVSTLVKNQVDTIIEPYKAWLAPGLALLFFISLTSLSSFFALLLPPIIGLMFMILEKTNFIHFEKEMREIQKLVV